MTLGIHLTLLTMWAGKKVLLKSNFTYYVVGQIMALLYSIIEIDNMRGYLRLNLYLLLYLIIQYLIYRWAFNNSQNNIKFIAMIYSLGKQSAENNMKFLYNIIYISISLLHKTNIFIINKIEAFPGGRIAAPQVPKVSNL